MSRGKHHRARRRPINLAPFRAFAQACTDAAAATLRWQASMDKAMDEARRFDVDAARYRADREAGIPEVYRS